jgi:hypothetical protein
MRYYAHVCVTPRMGLKIRRGQPRGGSTPPPGTSVNIDDWMKWPPVQGRPFCAGACSGACSFTFRHRTHFRHRSQIPRSNPPLTGYELAKGDYTDLPS